MKRLPRVPTDGVQEVLLMSRGGTRLVWILIVGVPHVHYISYESVDSEFRASDGIQFLRTMKQYYVN